MRFISYIFKKSKWLHKYIGLVLILFLLWMSLTGVLLNHPDAIAGFSVPKWLIPENYHINNWNRSAMVDLVYSEDDPAVLYGAGNFGVWKSADSGKTFSPMMNGFTNKAFFIKTHDLQLFESEKKWLFASAHGGLFVCDLKTEKWQQIIPGHHDEIFRKVQVTDSLIVAFSNSNMYAATIENPLHFDLKQVGRVEAEQRVTLTKLFFDVHYGKAWGIIGLLLFDFIGLSIAFLCVSAFYAWFFPWKRRRSQKKGRTPSTLSQRKLFKWMFKYHLHLGIGIAVFMLTIGGTGLFMRPPMIAALADGSISASNYPGPYPNNPWYRLIFNALYDPIENNFIVQCDDGMWQGLADFSAPFEKIELGVPVFVMGATVFDSFQENDLLIGSFTGLFHWKRETGDAFSMRNGRKAEMVSTMRPSSYMTTGYLVLPDGREFMNTHEQGIIPLNNADRGEFLQQSDLLTNGYRMPLWNWLFEIHNARFFKGWIGDLYILIIPLGAFAFLLLTLSGIYDWVYLKVLRK